MSGIIEEELESTADSLHADAAKSNAESLKEKWQDMEYWIMLNSREKEEGQHSVNPLLKKLSKNNILTEVSKENISSISALRTLDVLPNREFDILTEWSRHFNAIVAHREDYIRTHVPYLYMCMFFIYDKRVILATILLNAYFVMIEVIAYYAWPGYTYSYGLIALAIFLFPFFSTMTIKGSFSVDTVGRFKEKDQERQSLLYSDVEESSSPVSPKKFNTYADADSKVQIGSLCGAMMRMFAVNRVAEDLYASSGQMKIRKSGVIHVTSFYELMEAGTHYLYTFANIKNADSLAVGRYATYGVSSMLVAALVGTIISLFWSYGILVSCVHDDVKGSNHCNREYFKFFAYGFYTLNHAATILGMSNVIITLATLLYGSELVNSLSKYWLLRYIPLRRIRVTEDQLLNLSLGPAYGNEAISVTTFVELLQRDAVERYLFLHNFLDSASAQWGTLLFLSMAFSLFIGIYLYFAIVYFLAETGHFRAEFFGSMIVCALILIFILLCVSYANTAVDKMIKIFKFAGYDDYAVLGTTDNSGRDHWKTYIEDTPIHWYIFGFPVTRSWLVAFVGGGVSTLAGAAILLYLGLA